jgi:hypothetical protein
LPSCIFSYKMETGFIKKKVKHEEGAVNAG